MTASVKEEFEHIVIGVITNSENEVLVSKRSLGTHLAGKLEFPGGKREVDETPQQALVRELNEELGIKVKRTSKLIQIYYTYLDRKVFLDVYKIADYSNKISANEGQELSWLNTFGLKFSDFPRANFGIIRALQLPRCIAVTPNAGNSESEFLLKFEELAKKKEIEIIQLRAHELVSTHYIKLAKTCLDICLNHNVKLILNRDAKSVLEVQAHGLHVTSKRLLELKRRPLGNEFFVGGSCHNKQEIKHSAALGLDYIFLGPVFEKSSNKTISLLGLKSFSSLIKSSVIPVYAIGGLRISDIEMIVKHGGQGIAAIRDIWPR